MSIHHEQFVSARARLESLGPVGSAIILQNNHASKVGSLAVAVDTLQSDPAFEDARVVYTNIDPEKTICGLLDELDSDSVQVIVAAGGDETARQAVEALARARDEHGRPARNKILTVLHRGNAGNLAANLGGGDPYIDPVEMILKGTLTAFRPGKVTHISGEGESKDRYFSTITGLGGLSLGSRALNTWMRKLPGYRNDRLRDAYERTLLVSYTFLAMRQFGLDVEIETSDSRLTESHTVQSFDIARAHHIGKHGRLPVALDGDKLFAFELGSRNPLEVWDWSQRIQSNTMPGTLHSPERTIRLRPDRGVWANVDGTHFFIPAGDTLEAALASECIQAFMLPATNKETSHTLAA